MAASDIPMCDYHLERRGMGRYDWPVPTEENPCVRCTTGFYPDWELVEVTEEEEKAFEDYVQRLLEQYNNS